MTALSLRVVVALLIAIVAASYGTGHDSCVFQKIFGVSRSEIVNIAPSQTSGDWSPNTTVIVFTHTHMVTTSFSVSFVDLRVQNPTTALALPNTDLLIANQTWVFLCSRTKKRAYTLTCKPSLLLPTSEKSRMWTRFQSTGGFALLFSVSEMIVLNIGKNYDLSLHKSIGLTDGSLPFKMLIPCCSSLDEAQVPYTSSATSNLTVGVSLSNGPGTSSLMISFVLEPGVSVIFQSAFWGPQRSIGVQPVGAPSVANGNVFSEANTSSGGIVFSIYYKDQTEPVPPFVWKPHSFEAGDNWIASSTYENYDTAAIFFRNSSAGPSIDWVWQKWMSDSQCGTCSTKLPCASQLSEVLAAFPQSSWFDPTQWATVGWLDDVIATVIEKPSLCKEQELNWCTFGGAWRSGFESGDSHALTDSAPACGVETGNQCQTGTACVYSGHCPGLEHTSQFVCSSSPCYQCPDNISCGQNETQLLKDGIDDEECCSS